jgi:hypothetical protein
MPGVLEGQLERKHFMGPSGKSQITVCSEFGINNWSGGIIKIRILGSLHGSCEMKLVALIKLLIKSPFENLHFFA